MNSIEQSLTENEQRRLIELTEEATRNKTHAQQLAIDAGKLLTATADRFEEYKNRGFFKRCWYAISGKQGELDRANQSDLISMQKFAYAYIEKLQEQNLVEAQAIAVIRNNLKELQVETGEIYDMISTIAKKFDARITRLEHVTALHDWVIHVSAQEQEFAKDKLAICFLQLVFDCLKVMREGRIPFESVENRDELTLMFKNFGIDVNKGYSVEEFVSKLFAEVEAFGFSRFVDIITMKVGDREIDPSFILDNVTGAGYNAIYHFSRKMSGMVDMAGRLSDKEAARRAMLESVLSNLNNPATKYTPLELALEILGGSLIAEEVFAEANGIALNPVPQIEEAQAFDIGALFSDYMTISDHPFLASSPSDMDKKTYLEAFALVYATVGYNDNSVHFRAMADLFGQNESLNRVEWLSKHPTQIKPMIPQMIATLSTDERKYAWCIDAIYLGCEKNGKDKTGRLKGAIAQVCKFLKVKDDVANRLLDGAEKLSVAKTSKEFVDGLLLMCGLTDAWKPILEIKGLSLKGAFASQRGALTALIKELETPGLIAQELFRSVQREASKAKCMEILSRVKTAMFELRPIFVAFNSDITRIESLLNQGFPGNINSAKRYAAMLSKALSAISTQLGMYENGDFAGNALTAGLQADGSAYEIATQSGDTPRKLSFEFRKVAGAPFDHGNIEAVEFLGDRWYAMVKEKGIWSSDNGDAWQNELPEDKCVSLHRNMRVFGDMLFAWDWLRILVRKDGANEWKELQLPWSGIDFDKHIEYIYKVGNGWVLQVAESTEYTYTDKGVIWDSTETASYNASAFYKCHALSETITWTKIGEFTTSDGFFVHPGAACFVEDGLVAMTDRDFYYCSFRNERAEDSGVCFQYAFKGNGWKTADYPLEALALPFKDRSGYVRPYSDLNARIIRHGEMLFCCCLAGIFGSKDGRVWELIEKNEFSLDNVKSCVDMRCWSDIIIASAACENQLSCSSDGKVFSHIPIEPYPSFIAYGRDSILIVDTDDNTGGIFLGKVKC